MVPIKQACTNAAEFAASVLEPERLKDWRLEEVEAGRVNGADAWLITVSMPRPVAGPRSVGEALGGLGFPVARDYKTFAVSKDTGEVLSMKIRELAGE